MTYASLNGDLITTDQLAIDPSDRGFLLGDGVFETMRLSRGRIRRLEAHLARLAEGATLLQIPLPPVDRLRASLEALIEANGLQSGSLRLTLTRGPGPRGLLPAAKTSPTLLITQASPAPPSGPCHLHLSRYRRDGSSPLSRIKHLNYLPQILSRLEADQAGYDDALLLAADGVRIAEASAASLVVLSQGRLVTPPLHDGALAGTARAELLRLGLCKERSLTLDDLKAAEAAWLVNSLSLREITGILDDAIAQDAALTKHLHDCLFEPVP
ncbi:aminotransferase class IV [Asaia astilbis]|uniref:aminotransferase class IV n=1 Tax=Asaia astilbis TaxID=610244 RepID=UPI0004709DB6|nr:aminotransferase class IV [Asaia astilbis]